MMHSLEEMFPPFALRITCGPLQLRMLRDDDLPVVQQLVEDGISTDEVPHPFLTSWHTREISYGDADKQPAASLRFWWTSRGSFVPDNWSMLMLVHHEGEAVGCQDIYSPHDFRITRSAASGSWLTVTRQGQGIGTLMRQAAVGLMFEHLDAVEMHSAYLEGNQASEAVSRKTGYQPNGQQRLAVEGVLRIERRVVVTPQTFVPPPYPIAVEGLDAFRRYIGLTP